MAKKTKDTSVALMGLERMFGKRKWFDFVGTGDRNGKSVLIVGSKTKPSRSRANQCVKYMGFDVVICGPWNIGGVRAQR